MRYIQELRDLNGKTIFILTEADIDHEKDGSKLTDLMVDGENVTSETLIAKHEVDSSLVVIDDDCHTFFNEKSPIKVGKILKWNLKEAEIQARKDGNWIEDK